MDYKFASTPKIEFGPGKIKLLPDIIGGYGTSVLLVTGKSSFYQTDKWDRLINTLEEKNISWHHDIIPGEPSPQMIDICVNSRDTPDPDVVAAIGGGSVLDAGKAISAMWKIKEPVKLYLEGVGDGRKHNGRKIPFIALPTTSGTGSEATKNAVISEVGPEGFKKSLRHDNFVPDLALLDPELTLSCPVSITAWSGMDAFTQLLESYLSVTASPITDSLAVSGLIKVAALLRKAVLSPEDTEARSDMMYAAMCSGITLANAGLGVVHGFASSVGGRIGVPHGLLCGTMMGVANEHTLNQLLKKGAGGETLQKYAEAGRIFHGSSHKDEIYYAEFLINLIHEYTQEFGLPGLGEYGLKKEMIAEIARSTSTKNNPVKHGDEELAEMLEKRL